jgi:hypothetical protein
MAPLHQLPYITQTPFGIWWKIGICVLLKKDAKMHHNHNNKE